MSNEDAELKEMLDLALSKKSSEAGILISEANELQNFISESICNSSLERNIVKKIQIPVIGDAYKLDYNLSTSPKIIIKLNCNTIPKDEKQFTNEENIFSIEELKNLVDNKRIFVESLIEQINNL